MLTAPETRTDRRARLRPHTVIVLDDDLPTLVALRRALRREPYDLLSADDPAKVLRWVEERDVSVVVSDVRMPGVEGTELLSEVRLLSPHTKGVLLTAYPASLLMDPELRAWVSRVILKPWEDGWLRGTLRGLLQRMDEPPSGHPQTFDGFDPDLGGEA